MSDLKVNIIKHPLIQHKLTLMRKKETGAKDFRQLLDEISMLMAYEVTRDFPTKDIEIETPVAKCVAKTLEPVEYFCKMPKDIDERLLLVVDPMLATGGSAIEAVEMLKKRGAKSMIFMCLLSAPEGIKAFNERHPDIPVYTACVDDHLNEHGYIVPGIGDAGDRIFGTI